MSQKPLFPFFVDICGKEGLVIGGGSVALRKIERLLPYGPHLTVCAPDICEPIRRIGDLRLLEAPFLPSFLDGKLFAIAATDSREVNAEISRLCRQTGILVNVVDDRDLCTFVFPALFSSGSLSIGVSTAGVSPSAAAYLKKEIAELIPPRFDEVLRWLDERRAVARKAFGTAGARSRYCAALFEMALFNGGPLDDEEADALLVGMKEDEERDGRR